MLKTETAQTLMTTGTMYTVEVWWRIHPDITSCSQRLQPVNHLIHVNMIPVFCMLSASFACSELAELHFPDLLALSCLILYITQWFLSMSEPTVSILLACSPVLYISLHFCMSVLYSLKRNRA